MTTFLFWNTCRNRVEENIKNLVRKYSIDVLILAECTMNPVNILNVLNNNTNEFFDYSPSNCDKIHIFSKFDRRYIIPISEHDRYTVRRLRLPATTEITIVAAHLPSKLYWDDNSQAAGSRDLSFEIRRAEQEIGHEKTLLVGDLNMNPFEFGLIGANGLHAVASKDIAMKRNRIVGGREFSFFYNPMWNFLGDRTPGPPGTYHHSGSSYNELFWHMFDQVLLKPDLLQYFDQDTLEIVLSDGQNSLLQRNGIPNKRNFSDHLPITFSLNL